MTAEGQRISAALAEKGSDLSGVVGAALADPAKWLGAIIDFLRSGDIQDTKIDPRDSWSILVGLAAECADRQPDLALNLVRSLIQTDPLLAAQVASGICDRRVVPILADLLLDPSHIVRWAAVEALADHNDPEITDLLAPMLRDPSRLVRATTIDELVRRGGPAAEAALAALAEAVATARPELAGDARRASLTIMGHRIGDRRHRTDR